MATGGDFEMAIDNGGVAHEEVGRFEVAGAEFALSTKRARQRSRGSSKRRTSR